VAGDGSSDVDIANIKLDYRGGRANRITPENLAGISDCWESGAEVLVTSHTTQYIDSQVATIASIADNGDIVLDSPIHKPISIAEDAQTAVEIALLTRNIRFTAAEDDVENPLHGGHLIVMHTPAPTMQRLVGIESHGFGQQGKLGRYPFHFHMCGSVAGSILSKNSVRNTKQRGIVVHGSNDLYLEGNILHNTRGHGFMLEDGAETGNTFIHNLGAVVMAWTFASPMPSPIMHLQPFGLPIPKTHGSETLLREHPIPAFGLRSAHECEGPAFTAIKIWYPTS